MKLAILATIFLPFIFKIEGDFFKVMPEINPKEVYTTKEIQDFLKISPSTMKRLLKKGIIKAYRVGGTYRIWGSEILQLVSPKLESKVYRKLYKPIKEKVKEAMERW